MLHFRATNHYTSLYTSTPVRMNAWLVGAITGYILFRTRDRKIKINKYLVFSIWCIVLLLMGCDVFQMLFFQRDRYSRILTAIHYSLTRVVWSISLAWLVFACVHGYGGMFKKIIFNVCGR